MGHSKMAEFVCVAPDARLSMHQYRNRGLCTPCRCHHARPLRFRGRIKRHWSNRQSGVSISFETVVFLARAGHSCAKVLGCLPSWERA
jgi:hypothetical protein